MSQSVIQRVYLGTPDTGIDISDYIESLSYLRSTTKDNQLELGSQGKSAEALLSLDDFYPNALITFNYGYITGDVSTTKSVVILDIEPDYSAGGGLRLMVRCVDKGHTMKKISSTRVWNKKSTEDIVTEVAQLHGLKAEVVPVDSSIEGNPSPSTIFWESLPQGNANDMQIVQNLATKVPGAEYISYVDNDILYFKPVGTSSDSKQTVNVSDATRVQKFRIKHRESVNTGELGLAKVNSGTGASEAIKENAKSLAKLAGPNFLGNVILSVQNGLIYKQQGNDNTPLRELGYSIDAVTGNKSSIFDLSPVIAKGIGMTLPAGDNVSKVSAVKSSKVDQPNQKGINKGLTNLPGNVAEKFLGSITNLPDSLDEDYTMGLNKLVGSNVSESELKAMGQNRQSKNTRKLLTATLVLYGDPTWELDTVITVTGVHERFIGNWYVESIKDDLKGSFMTTIELCKNAVKLSNNGVQAKSINNTVGAEKTANGNKQSSNDKIKVAAIDGTIYSTDKVLVPGYGTKAKIGTRN